MKIISPIREMFEVLRNVRDSEEMIGRRVKVDRTKTREQMIVALGARGREKYVNSEVLETMPTQGRKEEVVYFFPIKRAVLVEEYAHEFESRGLVPDPFAQLQVNIDDPLFADEHPNGVQWVDKDGNFCYAAIARWCGGRGVTVNCDERRWLCNAWLAGVQAIPRSNVLSNQLWV